VTEVITAAVEGRWQSDTQPQATFYGGYAGYFSDPDGHLWEVAHNPGFALGKDGSLTLPDFRRGTILNVRGHATFAST